MTKNKQLPLFTHQYPEWLLSNPGLLQLSYYVSYLVQLRKWYVMSGIRRWIKSHASTAEILDAGCGEGQYLFPIASNFRGKQITGIDKLESNIALCKMYADKMGLENTSFRIEEVEKLEEKNRFHFILCIGVLQYTKDDYGVIKRFHNSLRENGKLLLYTPVNNKTTLSFYKYLMQRYDNYETVQQRQKIYTETELFTILNDAGYSIVERKATYGLFGRLSNELLNTFLIIINRFSIPIKLMLIILLTFLYPLILLFMILDYLLPKKNGNGLWLVAEKK